MDGVQPCSEMKNNFNTIQSSCTTNFICKEPSSQEALTDSSEASDNQKSYKCSICKCTFFRQSHLRDHLNYHAGNLQYQCREINCHEAYFSWARLRRHLISRHKMKDVKKSLYVKKESKRHKCTYEGCNDAFDRHWKLISHMWKHTGEKLHRCTENGCDKAYTTVGRLRKHISKFHLPRNIKMMMHYVCSEDGCEKVYTTIGNLRRHYKNHHEKSESPFNCTTCDRKFKSLERLGHHKCAAYKCEECNLKFINVGAFKKHMKKIHYYQICSDPDCNKVFSKFSSLKEHKKTEHMKFFVCPTCNKKLSSKTHLKKHQQTHLSLEERKLFSCPFSECERFYTRKFNLDQHIRSSHEGVKFRCTVPGCEKSLVTKQKLQEHMKLHNPLRESQQRKQMARRQRKDAGQPKRCMAAKLSGVSISFREEQNILHSGYKKFVCSQQMSLLDESSKSSHDGCELLPQSLELSELDESDEL